MSESQSEKPGQLPGAELGSGDNAEVSAGKTSSGGLVLAVVFLVMVTAVGVTAFFTVRLGDSLRETAASKWPADETSSDNADSPATKQKPQVHKADPSEGADGGPVPGNAQPEQSPELGAAPDEAESAETGSGFELPVPRPVEKRIEAFSWPTSVSGYQLQASSGSSSVTYTFPKGGQTEAAIFVGGTMPDGAVTRILGGEQQRFIVVDNKVICAQVDGLPTCVIRTLSHTLVGQADKGSNIVALARLLSAVVDAA